MLQVVLPLSQGALGRSARAFLARHWFATLVSLIVVPLAWHLASSPLSTLLKVVPDDAFYYLQIAKNLARSGVSSFDGENLANGYHPGWLLLMTVLAGLFRSPELLLRAAVMVGLALHAGSGLVLREVLTALRCPPWLAALGAIAWLLGAPNLLNAGSVVEAPLFVLAFLLAFRFWLLRLEPLLESGERPPAADWSRFGLLLGLVVWARTEGILMLLAALLVSAIRLRRQPLTALGGPATTLLTALALIAPWVLYSQLTFGTLQQASGLMKMLWHDDAWAAMDPRSRWLDLLAQLRTWVVMSLPGVHQNVTSASLVLTLWKILAVIVATLSLSQVSSRRRASELLASLAWPLLYFGLAGFVYASRFRDIQSWYGAAPTVVVTITALALAGSVAAYPDEATRRGWRRLVALLLILHLPAQLRQYGHWLERGLWPWQVDVYRSTLTLAERLPAAARVGAFNAGIPAYFGQQRVINLDGLVNLSAVPHWQARTLDQYVRNVGLDYLIDETNALERATGFMRRPLDLEELGRFRLTGWPGDPTRYVWRILPAQP